MQMIMWLKLVFQKKVLKSIILFFKKNMIREKKEILYKVRPPSQQSKVLSVCPQRSI